MSYSIEKDKIRKNWNRASENSDIIVSQQNTNSFIVEIINQLNALNKGFLKLVDFTSDWILADTILDNGDITKNTKEFRVLFNNVDPNFIPYIHGEIIYRSSSSGNIPLDPTEGIPFDEEIGEFIKKNEIFTINEDSVEYITSMIMEQTINPLPEVEYKLVCYLFNPNYYTDR